MLRSHRVFVIFPGTTPLPGGRSNPSLQVNVRRPSGNLDSAFRRSSVPVRTPRSVARTLPCQGCHVAKSPSLAGSFARSRLFRGFLKFCTFDGCASGGRDGEYSESARSTGYQNLKMRSTLGACVLFCFRVPVGSGAPGSREAAFAVDSRDGGLRIRI